MPTRAAAPALLLLLALPVCVLGAVTFIADQRIHNPNLTPALGRGFSLTTYGVLSTCLDFEEKTEPTYNYDYSMESVNSEERETTKLQGKFQASMSWGFIKATVRGNMKSSKETNKKSYQIVTKMAMERYYSSVDDTTAELTPDAKAIIDKGDIIGFYQACGSGYIRSIRRTAELTAVFNLESTSETEAKEFSASLKISVFGRGGGGGSISSQSDRMSSKSSMTIKIKAFGLGLNKEGADTLVATSLEDYHKAVAFAFKSMQNDDVGMIRGIEVVPWMDNLQFQNAVDFSDVPYIKHTNAEGGSGDKPSGDADADADPSKAVTNPATDDMRSSVEVKAITTINGEFVQMIDSMYRQNMYLIASMRRCTGELKLLVDAGKGAYYLIDHTGFDMKRENSGITVNDVYGVVNTETLSARFTDAKNFIHDFYGPCIAAITDGADRGRMVRYWFDEPECNVACLRPHSQITKDESGNPVKDPTTKLITCGEAPNVSADSAPAELKALTLDGVVERFCMPEIDMLSPPKASGDDTK